MSLPAPAVDARAPFADLPQAMVGELLGSSRRLAGRLAADMSMMQSMRESVRGRLAPMIGRDSDAPRPPSPPTTAGVDGSHCAERMLATDIVAVAAVAVEGLAAGGAGRAGGAKRLWPRPRHFVRVESAAHDDASPVLARAVMSAMEVQLASLAPHDVVFVDGSLATAGIALDIAFHAHGGPDALARYLEEGGEGGGEGGVRFGPIGRTLSDYLRILAPPAGGGGAGNAAGPVVAAVAKYSQRSELCRRLGMPNLDDRGLLSLVLEPGEYVGPFVPARAAGRGLLSGPVPGGARERALSEAIADAVNAVHVLYYRPHRHSPAIRLEVGGFGAEGAAAAAAGRMLPPPDRAQDRGAARRGGADEKGGGGAAGAGTEQLGMLLEAVRLQTLGPGLMEPYPVYMADRMAKSLPRALPAVRGIAVSSMSASWARAAGAGGGGRAGAPAELYLAAKGYRT